MNELKKVAEYEWEDIGFRHSDYFEGRGTALTEWSDVFVGIGMNAGDAMYDALENAAMCGWDTEDIDGVEMGREEVDEIEEELYYHVALYLRGEE